MKHSGAQRVELAARIVDEHFLCLSVSDDGRGVPSAARDEIFRPFARLAEEGSQSGTGLGLAIVREVARAHGGAVSVESGTGGRGSVFTMRLDLSSAAREAQENS